MRVIAILDRSAGNESVGEMWKETSTFPGGTEIFDILQWAVMATERRLKKDVTFEMVERFKGNLTITIDQASIGD